MITPVFFAKVKQGELNYCNYRLLNGYLATLEGADLEVIIRRPRKDRSSQQNRYYWGVVVELLCESTGYTQDEMHNALRMLFLRDDSRQVPTIRSTAELTTVGFEEYLEKVRNWASDALGCDIPMPNEVDY
jgi:hypothetical protein